LPLFLLHLMISNSDNRQSRPQESRLRSSNSQRGDTNQPSRELSTQRNRIKKIREVKGMKFIAWIDRLIGPPRQSTFRQIYVVENQDWLAPVSNLTDQEAYDAIVALYETVNDEQYRVAMDDLKNSQQLRLQAQ